MLISEQLHHFILPPTIHKDSLFSTFSPTLAIFYLFSNSHSNRYEVIFHCGFYIFIKVSIIIIKI
jgi:hypothetical protein